jgi:hypothetical protein
MQFPPRLEYRAGQGRREREKERVMSIECETQQASTNLRLSSSLACTASHSSTNPVPSCCPYIVPLLSTTLHNWGERGRWERERDERRRRGWKRGGKGRWKRCEERE